jgi:PhoD-like phosphatase
LNNVRGIYPNGISRTGIIFLTLRVLAPMQTGAENHQPVCPVNETATNSDKILAKCDRDEGPADVRFTNAAQSYMEWMPLRRGPGVMGVVTSTSLTKVIEWGKLATVVVFDTRVSYRSKIPTLASCKSVHLETKRYAPCFSQFHCSQSMSIFSFSVFSPFGVAFASTNVSQYNQSPLREQFAAIAASVQLEVNNPNYTMIGDNIQILRNAFSNSKAAGKTWQIWAGATSTSLIFFLYSLIDFSPCS